MYVEKEEIARAKEMDLLTYLQNYEPDELVHVGGNVYSTKLHDSLKISNGVWCQWSTGIGGRSALDYLINVRGICLPQAVEIINRNALPPLPRAPTLAQSPAALPPQGFVLPPRNGDCKRVRSYLLGRGIDGAVINHCIKSGRLYEEQQYHNCVFVGFDAENIARYATKRGSTEKRFVCEVEGSDKRYSFSFSAGEQYRTLHLFESAVDLLSYATLCMRMSRSWQTLHLLSLSGVYLPKKGAAPTLPRALVQYLQDYPQIKTVSLHLDNDKAGRAASGAIAQLLQEDYEVTDRPPPTGKDVNDHLCSIVRPPRAAELTR